MSGLWDERAPRRTCPGAEVTNGAESLSAADKTARAGYQSGAPARECSAARSAAGHLDVPVHLFDQRLDGVELQRGALVVDEFQAHQVPVEVQVVVAVHIGLDGTQGRSGYPVDSVRAPRSVGREGRVGADGDGGRGTGQRRDPEVAGILLGDGEVSGVDTVRRDQAGRRRAEVRRREAELAPSAEAVVDHVGDRVQPTQSLVRGVHVALEQVAADPRGGDATGAGAVRTELVDGHDLEAVPLAELAHGLDGPRVAPAEQRILAEHHALHTQTLDQEDAHEVLGRVLREVDSELQVQDAVHPGQQEQTVTVLVAGEQGGADGVAHHVPRMRPEGERHRSERAGLGMMAQLIEHEAVSAMDPVVVADRDRGGSELSGHLLDGVPDGDAGHDAVMSFRGPDAPSRCVQSAQGAQSSRGSARRGRRGTEDRRCTL